MSLLCSLMVFQDVGTNERKETLTGHCRKNKHINPVSFYLFTKVSALYAVFKAIYVFQAFLFHVYWIIKPLKERLSTEVK